MNVNDFKIFKLFFYFQFLYEIEVIPREKVHHLYLFKQRIVSNISSNLKHSFYTLSVLDNDSLEVIIH